MLHGQLLSNNSYVSLEELGEGLINSLLCVTDKDISTSGHREGEWYFPNGTQVPIQGAGLNFYRNRHTQIVHLHQRYATANLFGMFRCEVSNRDQVLHVLYAGIFPSGGGTYTTHIATDTYHQMFIACRYGSFVFRDPVSVAI